MEQYLAVSVQASKFLRCIRQISHINLCLKRLSKTGHQDKQQAARENNGGKDQLQEGIASNETKEKAIFKNGPSNLELTSSTQIMKNTIDDLDDWHDVQSTGNSLHVQINVENPRGVAWHPDLRFHQIWFWKKSYCDNWQNTKQ